MQGWNEGEQDHDNQEGQPAVIEEEEEQGEEEGQGVVMTEEHDDDDDDDDDYMPTESTTESEDDEDDDDEDDVSDTPWQCWEMSTRLSIRRRRASPSSWRMTTPLTPHPPPSPPQD